VLISNGSGEAVGYALNPLEDRGVLFVSPGEPIYEGMIIGENAKPDDLEVNPMKSKQLTNFRSTGKDDAIRLTPPRGHDAGTGDRLYRRRRDGRSDAQVHPPAQGHLDPHERKKACGRCGRRRTRARAPPSAPVLPAPHSSSAGRGMRRRPS
jgi:GTP-binding protein